MAASHSTDPRLPSAHDVRESLLKQYDRAAATHPAACEMRVIDAAGHEHPLTERQLEHRKAAQWAPGVLAPPM